MIYLYSTTNYEKFKKHLFSSADDYLDIETQSIYSRNEIVNQINKDSFVSALFDECANVYIVLTKNNIRRLEIF